MTIILLQVETVPFSNLTREVMLHLPMAPEFEVEYRMKQAVRDFCRASRLYRQENTDLLVTIAGQQTYSASLDLGTEVVSVVTAWNGSTELNAELPGERFDAQPETSGSTWTIGIDPTVDAFRLSPAPDTTGITIIGTVALATTEDSTEFPAFIWKRWRSVVAAGCLAYMKEQREKPWSAPDEAAFFRRRFEDGCREASNVAGPVRRRPLRVQPV